MMAVLAAVLPIVSEVLALPVHPGTAEKAGNVDAAQGFLSGPEFRCQSRTGSGANQRREQVRARQRCWKPC